MSAILQRHDFRANTMPVPPAWQAAAPRLMAASRSEFLTLGEHAAVVWLVVRGQAQVAAQEGRFMGGAVGGIWQAVMNDFHARWGLADVRIAINDMGATPAVVSLRLDQAVESALAGGPL